MKISRNVKIDLSVEDLNAILKKHFSESGIEIDTCYFNIGTDNSDLFDRGNPVRIVTGISLTGTDAGVNNDDDYKPGL